MSHDDLRASLDLARLAEKQSDAIWVALSHLQRGQNLDVLHAIEILKEAQK